MHVLIISYFHNPHLQLCVMPGTTIKHPLLMDKAQFLNSNLLSYLSVQKSSAYTWWNFFVCGYVWPLAYA